MEINNKKYRIIERTFGDGHKEYTAQYLFLNFGLFKIWRNYICDVWDYGYATVNFICCGHSYEDCKQHLLESINKKEEERLKKKIINKVSYTI